MIERSHDPDITTLAGVVEAGRGRGLLNDTQWRGVTEHLHLSRRESQIVQCMFDGKKQVAIADELGISSHTVHTHVERIYGKLQVHDRCEMLLRVFGAHLTLNAPDGGLPTDE